MNIGTLVAVGAALLFGTAQFLNATVSAQVPGVTVARWTLGGGALLTAIATAVIRPGLSTGSTMWALLAGAGGALGAAALYRSLERGNVSVAIPLCTTTATAIPVAVGLLLLGEDADTSTAAGLIAALVAIVLISSSRENTRPPPGLHATAERRPDTRKTVPSATRWSTVVLPLLAGVGVAVELVGITRLPADQKIALLWVSFTVGVLLLLPIPTPPRAPVRRRDIAAVIAAGALTATAMFAFHQATELTGLSVAGVIIGLYLAVPVALAVIVLRERPGRSRVFGLVCATVAVLIIGGR